ncbi:hypothetical protein ACIGXM_27040 [Kitasatospora sp. NPDC052896]|uniref:hypothetical protein n=1 Tax=Kitasatospora sp. NPDC052896 TaxID=3364061 RepID=UPI0037CCB2EB
MGAIGSGDTSGVWLARTVLALLEEKYGRGKVPSVRRLAQHIRDANGGAKISHGHVHNILTGDATNITDRTREMLARFFGLPPSRFVPAVDTPPPAGAHHLQETLAFRFASLQPAELAAIEAAVRIVREHKQDGPRAAGPADRRGVSGEPIEGR